MKRRNVAKRAVQNASAQKSMLKEAEFEAPEHGFASWLKQRTLSKLQRGVLKKKQAQITRKKQFIESLTHEDLVQIVDTVYKTLHVSRSDSPFGSIQKTAFGITIFITPNAWAKIRDLIANQRAWEAETILGGYAFRVDYKGEAIPINMFSTKYHTPKDAMFSEILNEHEHSHSITNIFRSRKARSLTQVFVDTAKDEIVACLYEPQYLDAQVNMRKLLDSTRNKYKTGTETFEKETARLEELISLTGKVKINRRTLAELIRNNSVEKSIQLLKLLQKRKR